MEAVIMGALSLCAVQDLRKKEITCRCLGVTAAVILLALLIGPDIGVCNRMGGACIGLCLLLMGKVTGQIGMADGILLTLTGVYLGWQKNLAVLFLALFVTAFVALFLLIVKRKTRKYEIPFVPFLCLAFAMVQWG